MAHNVIDCQWSNPDAIGIGVLSQVADWPIANAVVIDNETAMSPPAVSSTGGSAVGPWSVQIPMPPKFTWTNAANLTAVNRDSGFTVNWTGGDPNGFAAISGSSAVNLSLSGATPAGTAAWFVCTAPVSARTFFVPPVVTRSLPASGTLNILGTDVAFSVLSVRSTGQWIPFTAPGITAGTAGLMLATSQAATFR